jgi:hypothetical protein
MKLARSAARRSRIRSIDMRTNVSAAALFGSLFSSRLMPARDVQGPFGLFTLLQPPDRGGVHCIRSRDISLRLARPVAAQGPPAADVRQLTRAEPDAAILRTLPALTCPGSDQLTLELG